MAMAWKWYGDATGRPQGTRVGAGSRFKTRQVSSSSDVADTRVGAADDIESALIEKFGSGRLFTAEGNTVS